MTSRFIFLDTGPLSLITQRKGHLEGEACRAWLAGVLANGSSVFVPEIADYELRRELLRAGKTAAIARLDAFNAAEPDRYLPLTTPALRRAAALWAQARNQGTPTASADALDGDVILAAQALEYRSFDLIVATTNVAHLTRFVPADTWGRIR